MIAQRPAQFLDLVGLAIERAGDHEEDALRIVAEGVNALRGPNLGVLLITHYQRLLNYIVPDYVHVMYDGRLVKSGDKSLALELESKGYDWVKKELAASAA